MTPQIWACWRHYLECRAVGRFPEDPIVTRNAAIFREVLDQRDRLALDKLAAKIELLTAFRTLGLR